MDINQVKVKWESIKDYRELSIHDYGEMLEVCISHIEGLERAQQNVQRNGLTPSQKEEVQQMIMSALATGSV
jgi:hypothetical protein